MTWICGETSFSASYVFARSEVYAGADTLSPASSNCGIQKPFRFGSFATMKSRTVGSRRASAAVCSANCACSSSVSGVSRFR
jgi:hypothetical protein